MMRQFFGGKETLSDFCREEKKGEKGYGGKGKEEEEEDDGSSVDEENQGLFCPLVHEEKNSKNAAPFQANPLMNGLSPPGYLDCQEIEFD
ncbi:hypothetical protein Ahy_A03g013631 [Arachis hypogaea]|uniref:Uncharacterized protein n=1 Tax=Arachis hypogaea TaxID=3818 RepID=A0A445DVV4_ARAHY|nr:hypothetical protein Ahy_A03g013631 [Arachis hypogaea]